MDGRLRQRDREKEDEEGGLIRKKEPDSRTRVLRCINAALEKKAKDLVILNVREISAFADYFIICSGTSDRQVRAIAAAIQENLKTADILPLGVEGEAAGQWVLMDYDDVIIHIFLETIVQIDYPPLHRHIAHELLAGSFGKVVLFPEIEHLLDGFLMTETCNIVIRQAIPGTEFRGIGI